MADKFTELGNVMESYANKIVKTLRDRLDKDESNASYQLWQSIEFPVTIYGTKYTMELKMNKYWKWVDEGRKAGKVEIAPLVNWIAHKGIDSVGIISSMKKPLTRKNKTLKRSILTPTKATNQLAYMIAHKIGRHGTKGTHFKTEMLNDKFEADFKKAIITAIRKDIIININKGLK